MAKGNKLAYLNASNSLITGDLDTTEDENRNYIDLIRESYNVKKPDLDNKTEVDNAINQYFERCYQHNIKPGNMGLYNALGLTRQEVNEYMNGRRKASPFLLDTIKKAKLMMAEYREILGSQGKLSPPVLIFWQKNHDGFEDVQRIDIDANSAPKPELTPDEIAEKIEKDIPIDIDYKEL